MIQVLRDIARVVQDGLPLTYQRKPAEINHRLILEYFNKEDHPNQISTLRIIFLVDKNISNLEQEQLDLLLLLVDDNKNIFLEKNKELAEENIKNIIDNMKEDNNMESEKEQILENVWAFIMSIAENVEEWALNPMKWYIQLKKIAKAVANSLKLIENEAYTDFDNWGKNDLPYGFSGMMTNRLTVKYVQDPIYSGINDKLKDRQDILKEAVEQHKKWRSINDSEGNVITCPEYSYKASLVVKQWTTKKVGNRFITTKKNAEK